MAVDTFTDPTYTIFMDRLEKILRNIGLEEQQVALFTDLSKNGPATVLELASRTGFKRPTVHFHAEQLLATQLIEEENRAGRRLLLACGYDSLRKIVQSKLDEAESTGELLASILDEVEVLSDIDRAGSIQFSMEEGVDAVLMVYRNAAASTGVLSFININASQKISEIRPIAFGKKQKQGFSFSECGPEGPAEEMTRFSWYSFRHSPVQIRGPVVNVLVYSRKVSIISVYEHNKIRVLTIEQPSLVEVMRGLLQR